MTPPAHPAPPLWRQVLVFTACFVLILTFGAAALGVLLAPQIDWAGLWGIFLTLPPPRPPKRMPRAGPRLQ